MGGDHWHHLGDCLLACYVGCARPRILGFELVDEAGVATTRFNLIH